MRHMIDDRLLFRHQFSNDNYQNCCHTEGNYHLKEFFTTHDENWNISEHFTFLLFSHKFSRFLQLFSLLRQINSYI